MSLLIFGSANKIAQGIVKRLYGSGAYERIVCADLYPNYWAHQRWINFRGELEGVQTSTKLTDIKISEKSDLANAVKGATHVVYVTHDYYVATSSKLNLIKTTAELSKIYKSKSFVALTPVEHDHYNEENPYHAVAQSEKDAFTANPNMIHLKTDLTFGPHSTAIESIIGRFVNQESFYFDNSNSGQVCKPVHTSDVADVVDVVLKDNSYAGKSLGVEGPESVTLDSLVRTLESHVGEGQKVNTNFWEKLVSPTSVNLLTERIYSPCYINLATLLKKYKPLDSLPRAPLGQNLKRFENTYQPQQVNRDLYNYRDSSIERNIKTFLY